MVSLCAAVALGLLAGAYAVSSFASFAIYLEEKPEYILQEVMFSNALSVDIYCIIYHLVEEVSPERENVQ